MNADRVGLTARLALRLRPLTVAIAAVIALTPPATYAVHESIALNRAATAHAEDLAERLARAARAHPGFSSAPGDAYAETVRAFVRRAVDIVSIRILDETGARVGGYEWTAAGFAGASRVATIHASAALPRTDGRAASVEIALSRHRMLAITAAIGVVAALAGSALAALVYLFPVRVARGMERQIGALVDRVESRVERLQALNRVSHLISSSLDMERVLTGVAAAAASIAGAAFVTVWTADERDGTLAVAACAGARGTAWPTFPRVTVAPGAGVIGQVATTGETIARSHGVEEPAVPATEWFSRERLTSHYGVPIVFQGQVLGVLCFHDRSPFSFEPDERAVVESFAAQAAVALHNARLFEASETARRGAEAVADVGRVLAQTLDPDVVGERILERMRELVRGRWAALFRLEPGTGRLVSVVHGETDSLPKDFALAPGAGVAGFAVTERQPIASHDFRSDPRIHLTPDLRRHGEHARYPAVLSVPLLLRDTVIGALTVADVAGRTFTAEDIRLLQTFADQAALALESARLHRETQRALAAVEAKNAELDGFVSSVSHDLTAPLVAARGLADALAEDCVDALGERGRHYVARIAANVDEMHRLIHDLLALSRLARGERPAERVDVGELVQTAIERHDESLRRHGITVSVHPLGDAWAVRTHLQQVVDNLLANAVKYSAPVPAPRVAITASTRGAWMECAIADNGIGIDPAYHERIFQAFERLGDVDAPGTGLGLAIVRRLVESAGGRVWVESEPGRGATFRFTWPRTPLGGAESAARRPEGSACAPEGGARATDGWHPPRAPHAA